MGQAGGARRRPHDLPQATGRHEHLRARRERRELPDRHQPRQRQGGRRAGPGDARQVHARRRDLRRHLPQALPRWGGSGFEARRRPAQRRRGPAAHGQRRQETPHRRHHRQRRLRHAPGDARRDREADVPPAALGDERDAGRSRGGAAGNARQLRRADHEQLVRGRVVQLQRVPVRLQPRHHREPELRERFRSRGTAPRTSRSPRARRWTSSSSERRRSSSTPSCSRPASSRSARS